MDRKLFSEFPPISNKEWEDVVLNDLKGADFEKKLVWKSLEGIDVMPYYREDILERLKHLESMPGDFPYNRGTNKETGWDICETVRVDDVKIANTNALNRIANGATFLGFDIKKNLSTQDFEQLLEKIDVEQIGINFYSGNRNGWYTNLFSYYIDKEGYNRKKIYGSDDFDTLGHVLKHGEYPCKHQDCLCAENLVDMLKIQMPNFKLISVNARHIGNAGASVVQELGYGLAMGAEYFSKLDRCRLTVDDMAKTMRFVFSVGSNYFFEIAKLRAARLLWSKIIEANNPQCIDSAKMYIHTETSRWNKSIYDPYVNLLRSTTEAMAAVIGGTDSLTIVPFDRFYKKPDDFSNRMSRNIQLILKEEAHFGKVKDPGAGSYYIEFLTDAIAEKAWEIFLNVQNNGGFIESFRKGIIQKDVQETANKRNINIAQRKEVFVGINQYPNLVETLKNIDLEYSFSKPAKTGYIGNALKLYRGPEDFEKMRLATDMAEKQPVVFLLTLGDVTFRRARAQFSSGFFAAAGFRIIDNIGFDSLDAGISDALEKDSEIVVICSSDDEYKTFATEIAKRLKDKIIVIAGNPACRPELEEKGIVNYIHFKSPILDELKRYQDLLKINPLN